MSEKRKTAEDPEEKPLKGRIDFDEVRKVIALLEEKNLSEFEFEARGFRVRIGRFGTAPSPVQAPAVTVPTPGPAGEAATPAQAAGSETEANLQIVTSPMVGTFYRAPDPTSPPFVDIGDSVKKGQTLCIIEAMKLMNEIEADTEGTVEEIYVENAKPVEYGQRLFAIKPLA
jgi:acetyl-CoA carboxylase biotin carboxyl carrier protein